MKITFNKKNILDMLCQHLQDNDIEIDRLNDEDVIFSKKVKNGVESNVKIDSIIILLDREN